MRLVPAFATAAAAASLSLICLENTAAATPTTRDVRVQYADIVYASYIDTLAAAKVMQASIAKFIAKPSAAGLEGARRAWLAAREVYGQTEAYRFYGGPIDSEDGPEGRINAWPLDEAYIDAVRGRADAGIVNDKGVRIDAKTLAAMNEKDGEENISTGWHAVEFLLWGQDLSDDGPGARPWTDFVDGGAPNADRRRRYLEVVTSVLIDDLATLQRAWSPTAKSNYRARFVADPDGIRKMLTGIGVLTRGELAGERIEVALDSQSQEDEHSCFSDNTHRDIVANTIGIRNVWRGEYRRSDGTLLSGPSLRDLVAAKDPAVAKRVDAYIDASVAAAEAIVAPFDQSIRAGAAGRKEIEATVEALKRQAVGLVDAATVLSIRRLDTSLPE